MPNPRAEIGERWWVEGLGWRVVVSIKHHKKQGRLYGVRDAKIPEYPLGPVSADRARGRFVRARSLRRRDKRKRITNLKQQSASQNQRELVAAGRRVLSSKGTENG